MWRVIVVVSVGIEPTTDPALLGYRCITWICVTITPKYLRKYMTQEELSAVENRANNVKDINVNLEKGISRLSEALTSQMISDD